MTPDETIAEQAALWAVRTGDPGFADWDGFTLWLEQDPAHAEAYDRAMAAADEAAAILPAAPPAANDDAPAFVAPPAPQRRRWWGGGIAAALAAVALVGTLTLRSGADSFETAPGETRLVTLDNGDTVLLAGDTRLELDEGKAFARLERGRALFTLRAEGGTPLTVAVGEDRLVDVGTVFDVARRPGGLSVAVSEGAVVFDPAGEKLHVSPGQVLRHDDASGRSRIAAIPADQVGEWSEGRLTFDAAPLADVAEELSRATGARFVAGKGPAISGSILVDPVRADPRSLGALLGVPVRREGEAWLIGTP